MRICFIADASSIHVQRIISFYIRKKDDILVLSTAQKSSDISGTRTIHLLDQNKSAPLPSSFRQGETTKSINILKSFIPSHLTSFVKLILRIVRLLSKYKFCRQKIQHFDPEVIYGFRSFPEGVLTSRCHVRPLLLRTAGSDISKFPKYPVYRQVIRKALCTADIVVTESHWERTLLHNLCGARVDPEVRIIGVDTTLFRPPLSQESLREKYGLRRDAFVVISNRYLAGHYNGWMVVNAIQSIMEQCPALVLLYLNPSTMGLHIRTKADAITASFPRIKFLDGPVPHWVMPEILGCGDIYISFSAFDGVPNSLLEAMACGLVPIVGELPQLHEWVEPGVTGYFVPQTDIKGLASVVCDLYQNRQTLPEMSVQCIATIREQGSFDVCSAYIRELLESLAQKRQPIL